MSILCRNCHIHMHDGRRPRETLWYDHDQLASERRLWNCLMWLPRLIHKCRCLDRFSLYRGNASLLGYHDTVGNGKNRESNHFEHLKPNLSWEIEFESSQAACIHSLNQLACTFPTVDLNIVILSSIEDRIESSISVQSSWMRGMFSPTDAMRPCPASNPPCPSPPSFLTSFPSLSLSLSLVMGKAVAVDGMAASLWSGLLIPFRETNLSLHMSAHQTVWPHAIQICS